MTEYVDGRLPIRRIRKDSKSYFIDTVEFRAQDKTEHTARMQKGKSGIVRLFVDDREVENKELGISITKLFDTKLWKTVGGQMTDDVAVRVAIARCLC